jgi:glycerol-3-phosphate cytidylyltransferase-like family protein
VYHQAKALGDVLVVGLVPDKEIMRCKGPPVLNDEERYTLVDAVKWVDEIISGDMGHLLGGCSTCRGALKSRCVGATKANTAM